MSSVASEHDMRIPRDRSLSDLSDDDAIVWPRMQGGNLWGNLWGKPLGEPLSDLVAYWPNLGFTMLLKIDPNE
jgi:hypothetical protein